MAAKRITARQGIIEDCGMELAAIFPHCDEKTYRQNIDMYIGKHILKNAARIAYMDGLRHSNFPLKRYGITRLYNAIARAAVRNDRVCNPRLDMRLSDWQAGQRAAIHIGFKKS